MTPKDLYRTYRVSACRLETLQHYMPGDEDRQRAFHARKPLPPPQDWLEDELRLIARLRDAGRHVGRVHVVDRPLSAYLRYELAVYPENVTAGEDVRIADRSLHPELAGLAQDFTLFDAGTADATAVLFDYDSSGLVHGYKITSDPGIVERCQEQYALALSRAVSLGEFTAAIAA